MVSRFGVMILSVAVTLACVRSAPAAPAAPGPAAHAAPPASTPPTARPAGPTPGSDGAGAARDPAPQVSQDAAARARMHECGHQWSAIKKAGNAGTMTWKDFSATCLVVSK